MLAKGAAGLKKIITNSRWCDTGLYCLVGTALREDKATLRRCFGSCV